MIRESKIQSLSSHVSPQLKGHEVEIYVRVGQVGQVGLARAGFSAPLSAGESVLPSPVGPVALYNAEGRIYKHTDEPMETAYAQAPWTWTDWSGQEHHMIVERPYQRYRRSLVPPPSLEVVVTQKGDEQILVIGGLMYDEAGKEMLLHAINLMLELFGIADVIDAAAYELPMKVKRLNWDILPAGERPWPVLKSALEPTLRGVTKNTRELLEYRLKAITSHRPDFAAIGRAGFRGYVVFGFSKMNIFVLESLFYGNATYVFESDWELLSQLTKAQIINQHLQRNRFVHRNGWLGQIDRLLEGTRSR